MTKFDTIMTVGTDISPELVIEYAKKMIVIMPDETVAYFVSLQQCEEIRLAFHHPDNRKRSVTGAAKIMNLSRDTVHRKMKLSGLRAADFQGADSVLELIAKSHKLRRIKRRLYNALLKEAEWNAAQRTELREEKKDVV